MNNLIIHPKDPSTQFLSPIYAPLKNKTVIEGWRSKAEICDLIESHDRVIILGHGTSDGLMSVGQFPDAGFLIVDESMAGLLKRNPENIYIWCNADQFVQRHGLSGLNCGMFISEIEEAYCYGFKIFDWDLINQSNDGFASIMSKHINEPLPFFYRKLLHEYGLLANNNLIARFNLERLYLTYAGINQHPEIAEVLEIS